TAFGELPSSIQGAEVLPLSPDGSDAVRLPWSSPASNTLTNAVELDVQPDQSMSGRFELALEGEFAQMGRSILHNHTAARQPRYFAALLGLDTVDEPTLESIEGA